MLTKKKQPMRQCIGCREMKNKVDLIRIVKNAEGEVFIDLVGKANGRGAYICKNPDCFSAAQKKNSFERALKSKISDEVIGSLKEEIINE